MIFNRIKQNHQINNVKLKVCCNRYQAKAPTERCLQCFLQFLLEGEFHMQTKDLYSTITVVSLSLNYFVVKFIYWFYTFICSKIDSGIVFIKNNNYIWSCLDSTTSSTVSDVRRTTVYKKENTNSMLVTIIAAVLGAVLFVLILLLVVVVLRKRKKRLEKGT